MQKSNEDEKKLNLIKCPLPKIIYTTMSRYTTFSKNSENTSSNNTYYSKLNSIQNTNQNTGLPSLKSSKKFHSSPNKTNYDNIKINSSTQKNDITNINNNLKTRKITTYNHKEAKKQSLKELLNNYNLNKYYDKFVELGFNDQNIFNIGLMNKKEINEFISNLKMFPGHIIKMEKLYHYLKQIFFPSNIPSQINSNSKINDANINSNVNNNNNIFYTEKNHHSNNNNGVNYVTITFNRTHNIRNRIVNKIIHSQSLSKYSTINPTTNTNNQNLYNNNLEFAKAKANHQKENYSFNKNIKIKNKNIKNTFELPKPVNAGKNILIKYFFKDLKDFSNNMNEIVNNLNSTTNTNLPSSDNQTNNSSLTNTIREFKQEKKPINLSKTNNENHSSKIIIQENINNDLPSINNTNNFNINNYTSKTLINSHYTSNPSPKLIKNNRGRKRNIIFKKNKSNINDIFERTKTIDNEEIPYDMSKRDTIRNIRNNINKKTYNDDSSKKINGIKLKLPNVINKSNFQNSLSESNQKNILGNEVTHQKQSNDNMTENHNKNISINNYSNNNIVIKKEKTVLKKNNKSEISITKENDINTINNGAEHNDIKTKEENNTVVINSWDDNNIYEEQKPIRLRENTKEKNQNIYKNIMNNVKDEKYNKNINKENINNEKINKEKIENKKDNNKFMKLPKNNKDVLNKNSDIENNLSQKIEILDNNNQNKEKDFKNKNNSYTLEDLIYDNLRLNHTFSENNTQNVYSFDLEYVCKCFCISLLILIETSKESPHITEINLESLSSNNIKYFFFNEYFNENINLLFDLFDKEVNKDININQISPLDKLELLLTKKEENINFDISCLKHIKKKNDEILIQKEEEKEKNKEKNVKGNFKIHSGMGDIEKDIKFIDEFFSMNSRIKKKVINYQYVSEISKNVLCKELSYINEMDSELNGTNSNINNTNLVNNSNNNINDNSNIIKKNNTSNLIDNDEIKEENNNNFEEENNNTFNNEMNELGIINEDKDDKNESKKDISNNSIKLDDDMKEVIINTINKKEELKKFDMGLNEENKIITSPINNDKDYSNNIIDDENKNSDKNIEDNIYNNKTNENNNLNNNITVTINNNEDIDKSENNKEQKGQNPKVTKIEKVLKDLKKADNNVSNTQNKENTKEQDEDEKFESDYIIDINSINELTYYFIKRAEIFDEDFNYVIMRITERRYIEPPDTQTIFDFIADIILVTKMEKEVIILSLIYIERLIFNTGLLLNSRNWRRILFTAMVISSKIWDDYSFENNHFSQVFVNLGVNEINDLERIFLELINYKVYVKQSEYFSYLLMIKTIGQKYNYDGKQIIPVSVIRSKKYQEFTEVLQNRMRRKVTLNNSAQF